METQIGLQGMKVDPMFFEKFEDMVKAVRRLGYPEDIDLVPTWNVPWTLHRKRDTVGS